MLLGVPAAANEPGDDVFDSFDDEFSEDARMEAPYDPLEGFNRAITSFNDALFVHILEPAVMPAYHFVFSEPLRISIRNFFDNLYYPVSLVNNLLQLKLEGAAVETGRFLINSTFGFAGLFDPARNGLHWEPHVEDLGQTLGYYGAGNGFPIVLPFFGPTNLRDMTGDLLDFYVNPIYYVEVRKYNIVDNTYQGWGLVTYKEFNELSLYTKEYESIRKDAIDLYPFLRDAYEQRRNKLISE